MPPDRARVPQGRRPEARRDPAARDPPAQGRAAARVMALRVGRAAAPVERDPAADRGAAMAVSGAVAAGAGAADPRVDVPDIHRTDARRATGHLRSRREAATDAPMDDLPLGCDGDAPAGGRPDAGGARRDPRADPRPEPDRRVPGDDGERLHRVAAELA